jgi:putative FmdB family regulatory protein
MYITNGDKNMPIYSWHCQTCNELYDELLGMGKHSEACPECGESNQEKLLKQLTMPQKPKVHSSDTKPQDRWGYNKTTTETLFAADLPGGRQDKEYDENALKAQVRETAKKKMAKGATVAVTKAKSKVPTKK